MRMGIWALALVATAAAANPAAAQEATAAAAPEGPPAPPVAAAGSVRVLTLREAQEIAAERSYAMRNIDETIVQADAMIGGAWSMLLPSLSASGSITRNKSEVRMAFPDFSTMTIDPGTGAVDMEMTDLVLQEKWGRSFGFSANVTLLNPRAFPLLENAYDNAELARLTAKVQKNELLFAVTSAYYQVHTAKEIIAVYRENLALAADFVRSSEARVKAGRGTSIDVLRAKLVEMGAQKSLDNALDGLVAVKTALAYLVGLEGQQIDVAAPAPVAPPGEDTAALQREAVAARAELQAASVQTRMAERARVETWMKWLPVFDLTYAWSWSSASGFSGDNDSWMLIFGARWDLFDGGGRIAEARSRASQIRMSENSRAETERQIRQQVEQIVIDVRRQRRNVELADRQVEMAEQSHHQVVRQYEVGLATSLDLHDAEAELANAKVNRVVERLSYDLAMLALEKAIGEYSSFAEVAPR